MLDELGLMFPEAQFIHLRRDPRRAVNSMINFKLRVDYLKEAEDATQAVLPSWSKDFRDACQTWAMCTDCAQYFEQCFPQRCLTILYETLSIDPYATFDRSIRFPWRRERTLSVRVFS